MKAVIFGAGNIGRGFIAPLFSFDGWEVTFVDVAKNVIEEINKTHEYPLNIVSNEGTNTLTVRNVSAVDGNDKDAASDVIAAADVCATCVGAKAIKYILPNFSAGVKKRLASGGGPLNLLICENLMDADVYIRGLLSDMLTPDELENVGLIETSVGRMVPVPKAKAAGENPLSIAVEEYGVLPVDRGAIKGEWRDVKNIVPFSPFHFYVERKLYIHNMGHAICAYLGKALFGYEYIYESVANPEIKLVAENAMIESAMALSKKYGAEFSPLMDHVWDLIRRFGNRALGDTCERVGADIPRKLAKSDRLTGAALNAEAEGVAPTFISVGIAAALYEYMKENPEKKDAISALTELSSLEPDSKIARCAAEFYSMLQSGASLTDVIAKADSVKKQTVGMII